MDETTPNAIHQFCSLNLTYHTVSVFSLAFATCKTYIIFDPILQLFGQAKMPDEQKFILW